MRAAINFRTNMRYRIEEAMLECMEKINKVQRDEILRKADCDEILCKVDCEKSVKYKYIVGVIVVGIGFFWFSRIS